MYCIARIVFCAVLDVTGKTSAGAPQSQTGTKVTVRVNDAQRIKQPPVPHLNLSSLTPHSNIFSARYENDFTLISNM